MFSLLCIAGDPHVVYLSVAQLGDTRLSCSCWSSPESPFSRVCQEQEAGGKMNTRQSKGSFFLFALIQHVSEKTNWNY